jgi:hypothetical protein
VNNVAVTPAYAVQKVKVGILAMDAKHIRKPLISYSPASSWLTALRNDFSNFSFILLQLSNVKPTQVNNGCTSKRNGNLNSPFEKADRILEKSLPAIILTKLRHYHFKPTYVRIYQKK